MSRLQSYGGGFFSYKCCVRLVDDFRPALGLSNSHAQTVFAALTRKPVTPAFTRQRVTTRDQDFFDVDRLDGERGKPTVVLVHGLEGSSGSGYMLQSARVAASMGWSVAALNHRSCSGEPNLRPDAYSSGSFRDLEAFVQSLAPPVVALGFSLGGSIVLNYLAQRAGSERLTAAAVVSVPYDLRGCAALLDSGRGFSVVYLQQFLRTMKAKALAKAQRFPTVLDATAISCARTIRDFDHVVTAPTFGYSSAEDYYARCSTGPQLRDVRVPTLLLSSADDSLAPPGPLHELAAGNPVLDVLLTARGGHVGFVGGSVVTPTFWAERRALEWLAQRV